MAGEDITEPLPDNVDIWNLLKLFSRQWLVGLQGIYGINMQAVMFAARELGIAIDWAFLIKLNAFESTLIKLVNEDKKNKCDENQKEKCQLEFGEHLAWACANCGDNKNGG